MAKRQKPKKINIKPEKVKEIQKKYFCPTILPKLNFKCCCGHDVLNCSYPMTGECRPKLK